MCVRTNRDASEHGGPQFLGPETVAEFRRSLDDGCASSPCSSAQHIASVRTSSAHLISQTFRAAGRPSLPRKMRQIQFLSEVRLVDVENPRDESLFFFRSFIARNLKVLLQISCRCLLATTVSFRIVSLKLIRFNAHRRLTLSFFDLFR